jgi:hypothetical protein
MGATETVKTTTEAGKFNTEVKRWSSKGRVIKKKSRW